MAVLRCASLTGLVACACVASAIDVHGQADESASFLHSVKYNYVLRVCNAYPYSSALDMTLDDTQLSTTPLKYKACHDFTPELLVSSKVDFKVWDVQ